MKIVTNSLSRILRLGFVASTLLLGQQALALGTDAGVTVSNQATVAYTVGVVVQTPIESSPTGNSTPGAGAPTLFLVDRRVDFTLIETSGGPTSPVAPNDLNVVASFTLQNNGNAIMDFSLAVADFAGAVFGNADGTDLNNYRVRAANGQGLGGVPTLADLPYVDELDEDEYVEIYVFADAPATVLNGQYANIQLTATAADDALAAATPGVLDAILAENPGVDDPTLIESVFADAGNDGIEQAEDSYEILANAALTITKLANVFSDPFGSGKALPGAVIEYVITIDNQTGVVAALGVSLSDTIQVADVELQNGVYDIGTSDSNVSFSDGTFCIADDAADTDGDGCSYDVGNGALVIAVPDVAAGSSMEVRFQVLIPNT
jgi:hypothetical protein